MATVKPKLQGYVREDLFIQFEDERRALGLSQSQALEKVLSERYKTPSAAANNPDRESLYWIIKSMEDLQERVKKLEISSNLESDSPGNLESNPPSNLESDSPGNLESNLESNSPGNLESDSPGNLPDNLESNLESDSPGNLESNPPSNLESDSPSNLPSNPPSNLESDSPSNLPSKSKLAKGLGQRALAKRLGCSYQTLGDLTIVKNGNIQDWSKQQDPQGFGWELRDEKYYPCNLDVNESI